MQVRPGALPGGESRPPARAGRSVFASKRRDGANWPRRRGETRGAGFNMNHDMQHTETQAMHLLVAMREADHRGDYRTVAEAFDAVEQLIASGRITRDRVHQIGSRLAGGAGEVEAM